MRFGFLKNEARQKTEQWVDRMISRSAVNYQRRTIPTTHGNTHLLDSAETHKEALVCLPGWGTCGAFWDVNHNLSRLASTFRLILVDLPGQPGLSEPKALPVKGGAYGGWLSEILDHLSLSRATFMGCSFGGFVLLQAYPRIQSRMNGLVLGAPAGLVPVRPTLTVLPALLAANFLPSRKRTQQFLRRAIFGSEPALEGGVEDELFRIVFLFQKYFRSDSLPPRTLTTEWLQNLTVPTLVAWGEEDRMINPQALGRAAQVKVPSLLEAVQLPGHGHSLELSHHLVDAADRFLSRVIPMAA